MVTARGQRRSPLSGFTVPARKAAAAERLGQEAPSAAHVLADGCRLRYADQAFAERFIRALREAGLPE